MTDDTHRLAAAYALDALDPEEAALFEAHYPDCETCSTELDEYRRTAARLGAMTPLPLPEDLKAKVMGSVSQTTQLPPMVPGDSPGSSPRTVGVREREPAHIRWARPLLAVAAVIAALALAGGLFAWRQSTDGGSNRTRGELAEVLSSKDATTVQLTGSTGTDEATLRVVYSANMGKAVVVGSHLPDPGHDRTYQLWSISGDTVRSAGVFNPAGSGAVDQRVELPTKAVDAWGVTNEPAGGSPKATTGMLFQGRPA